jgi:hypothetical protein
LIQVLDLKRKIGVFNMIIHADFWHVDDALSCSFFLFLPPPKQMRVIHNCLLDSALTCLVVAHADGVDAGRLAARTALLMPLRYTAVFDPHVHRRGPDAR